MHFSGAGFRTCVVTRSRTGQRLKPHSFLILSGAAEAVPYKDSAFPKQAFQAIGAGRSTVALAATKTHRLPLSLLRVKSVCPTSQLPALAIPWRDEKASALATRLPLRRHRSRPVTEKRWKA